MSYSGKLLRRLLVPVLLATSGTLIASGPAHGTVPAGVLSPVRASTASTPPDPDDPASTWSTTPGGDGVRPRITLSGQTARVVFPGRGGQRVSVLLHDGDFSGDLSVVLRDQTGTVLTEKARCFASGSRTCFLGAVTLPDAGTFTLAIASVEDQVGEVSVQVFDIPPDSVAPTTLDGTRQSLTTTTPGQRLGMTFTARAGRRVSLLATNSTFHGTVRVYFEQPDGTMAPAVGDLGELTRTGYFKPTRLSGAGAYTLWVDPDDSATGTVTLQAYDVPDDVSARLDIDSDPVTLHTAAPGQKAVLTFAVRAGQNPTMEMSEGSPSAGIFTMYDPLGYYLVGGYWPTSVIPDAGCTTVCLNLLGTMVMPGDYRLVFEPETAAMTMKIKMYDVSVDATATMVVDGPEVALTTRPGQNVTVSFEGTAGQTVSVIGSLPGYQSWAGWSYLRAPDGTALSAVRPYEDKVVHSAVELPTTGTYTVMIDPGTEFAGPITVAAYDVTGDAAEPDGSAAGLSRFRLDP